MTIRTATPHLILSLLALSACTTACTVESESEPEKDHSHESPDAAAATGVDESDDRDAGTIPGQGTDDHTSGDSGSQTSDPSPDTANDADGGTNSSEQDNDAGSDPGDETAPPADPSVTTSSFFLPTVEPDNTVAPRIRVDSNGGVHAVYAGYAGGGAYYAYCASECDDRDNFDVVYFPTDGTVANAMLTLTRDNQPRILLSAYMEATYATCDEDCTNEDNWEAGVVLQHDSKQEITGEALALDNDGNPHFLAHTYRAYLGIGQEDPFTYHAACYSGSCTSASDWTISEIADQIWEESRLQYDSDGAAHLGFVAVVMEEKSVKDRITAYATCSGECTTSEDWPAVGLVHTYVDDLEAISLSSSVAMDLTSEGKPRLLTLAKSEEGTKQLIYFECEEDCTSDTGFAGSILSTHEDINVGLDLSLDDRDRPRFVHTLDYNIFLAYCDDLPCNAPEASWKLEAVETSSSIPVDDIILYPNCSVAAWFLHTPSMALDSSGNPIVGYQARDISGGVHNADPTKPDCVAGTDMTLTRMTYMAWDAE
jgi:hypothetical protein